MSETTSPAETVETGSGYRSLALAGAGLALAASALARPAKAVTPALSFNDIPGTGDIKVLNYALALEALEANLYVQALQRLTTGGTNTVNGTVKQIPGLNVSTSEPDVKYVAQFGAIEAQHRNFLNDALGPNNSIIGTGSNGKLRTAQFDFGIENLTRQQVVGLLYTVEAAGVSAYLGAIKYFTTNTYLLAAGGIQATEARHTAAIAVVSNQLFGTTLSTAPLANQNSGPQGGATNTNGIDGTLEPNTVLTTVSPFIVIPTTVAI